MPEWLAYDPQDNLGFFADLQRNHFPPFYYIPALQDHPISLNDRHVAKERPARKVLRTLEADTDKSEMGLTGEVGIAECDTVLQAECKAESSNRGKENENEGMETVSCNDQQPHVASPSASETGNHRGSSVLTESEDGDNEHQVFTGSAFLNL